ncbi:MAG: transposase [Pseudomonadota bacterium]
MLVERIDGLDTRTTRTAVDMLGGVAIHLYAMLAEAGLPRVHTPALAINRARQDTRGGERKSVPKNAALIAELARTPADLRTVEPPDPLGAKIRLLAARRQELVTEHTRRAARLRGLDALLQAAVHAAQAQTVAIPDARLRAKIIADIAHDTLVARDRLKGTDQAIRERLATHRVAAIITSMPGRGTTPTAEFITLSGRIDRFNSANTLAGTA